MSWELRKLEYILNSYFMNGIKVYIKIVQTHAKQIIPSHKKPAVKPIKLLITESLIIPENISILQFYRASTMFCSIIRALPK